MPDYKDFRVELAWLNDETNWEMFPGSAELARKSIEREEMEQRDFMEWLKGGEVDG